MEQLAASQDRLKAAQAKVAHMQEEQQRMRKQLRERDSTIADLQQQAHKLMQLIEDRGLDAATSSSVGTGEGDLQGVDGPATSDGCSNVTPAAPRPEKIIADQRKWSQYAQKVALDERRYGFYKKGY